MTMMFFNLFSIFLSLVIAAVIQISFGLADVATNGTTTTETGPSPKTTTPATISAHPSVLIPSTIGPIDLVTPSSPNQVNVSDSEIGHKSNILPDSTTLLRTFYVLLAVTAIIIVYFVVRTVRLRMRKNRKMSYGLLSTNDDGLEMRHLDEDEEDATVFDRALSHSRR